ncbi:MAG: imidazole glycerol phosphate synthase subunit HisH [Ferruginibacter sp.]|nr:imidazole glycerol phosphate synthase subunit HisH [Ferruginibacter sp.]
MITIIDYGLGNLGSVKNMLKKIGVESEISKDLETVKKATKIILPGVGAFDPAMERLTNNPLRDLLDEKALQEKIPILGICLGMQLLTDGSEEGRLPGLGWVPASSYKFSAEEFPGLKIPHMGWNFVVRTNQHKLTDDFTDDFRFYFVHSYYVKAHQPKYSILSATYGVVFDAAVQNSNIMGVQFHAEKSHKYGMKLFQNFANI